MEVIQEAGPYLIGPSPKATSGQTCRRKHTNTWRSATSVRGLCQTYISQEGSSIHCPTLGRSLSGVWISSSPFPRQQGTKDICSLTLTTLLNGLKLNLYRISEILTLKNLFGKTLSPGSGSFTPSSRTIIFSSIAKPSGGTIANWELRIDILPQPTPRRMGKPKLLTRSLWTDLRKG